MSSFEPYYKVAPVGEIGKGEGAFTQEEYIAFTGHSWNEMGGTSIDESDLANRGFLYDAFARPHGKNLHSGRGQR